MAWLRDINSMCRECGKKPATVELLGKRNDSYGKFCKSCGSKRLKQQLKFEAEEKG
jgi:uncharacterized Zn finger protein